MSRRDVEADVLSALDAFVGRGNRLPATADGKVNVAALCRELGLRPSDAQHLFRKEAVKTVVNALAEEQGLLHIGARADREAADQAIHDGIARVGAQARRDAQAATMAAEQSAAAVVLIEELAQARAEIEALKLARSSLEARLHIFEDGGLPPRF